MQPTATDSHSAQDFVHLHVHTQYSLLDGAIRLGDLFAQAKAFGMPAVAITDHGTMFGAVDFYQQANKAGIKPIIGCECYLAPRTLIDKTPQDHKGTRHLVLLARNMDGYRSLCKLASVAQMKGFYYKPRIDKALLEENAKGLIALSACLKGEVAQWILAGRMDEASRSARYYQQLFGEENYYLEVQNNGLEAQERVNAGLRELSQSLGIPLVATNDCHYLRREDARAHEVLLCVQTGKTIHDTDRFQFDSDHLYFKAPEEMVGYFDAYPDAIANTLRIADRCEIAFDFDTYHFPQYDAESSKTADELFEEKVREGFAERLRAILAKNPDADQKLYAERLEYELKTIIDMGFPGYFLIVSDFILYAKNAGIPVGPGRGSAAGSLVSYALFITDLDPIEHGLIFERFLNPSRISMPDIDVDFCIHGREQVFKYVVERYGGGDYVAQIITYGKMKARAVIRDVGRALGVPLAEVDVIAKLVPDDLKITIPKALEQEPRLAELANSDPRIGDLIEVSQALEGLPRHASTHAAGVVIGDKPLVEYLPLYKGKKGEIVTQFDMNIVEKIGLVKFDFLGLRNLTVIDDCLKMIAQQGVAPPDLAHLPDNDEKTYRLLQAGDTTGVFQLESSGMKDLLVRLKPESFADLTALVALYRPGPLDSGMVDDFVERKHGRKKVAYLVDSLEPILKETYGVMVYQEQVMQVAGVLANYTMADADSLRKAIGKKIKALMAEHREKFISGAVSNGVEQQAATDLFDLIEKFGGYGFNKSHSAAYALISYQTAYLKAHYPVEFMAALLTSEMGSIDGVVKFIGECRAHSIEVLPPDINASSKSFTVNGGSIRFGLVAVKNVGGNAIDAIIEARAADGPFDTLFNFCERVDLRRVNKRVVESLIRCGAFDATGASRASMEATLEDALDYGQCIQKEKADPQMGLFDTCRIEDQHLNVPPLAQVPEWDEKAKLALEKEALGFYISGHPLERFEAVMAKYSGLNAETLADRTNGSLVRLGGTLQTTKVIRTKREELMAFATLEDMRGSVEVVVFPSVYAEAGDLLVADAPLFVQGELKKEEGGLKILADTIIPIEQAEALWTATVHFKLDLGKTQGDTLADLQRIIRRHPGTCKSFIHLVAPGLSETVIALGADYALTATPELGREVRACLGYAAVETACTTARRRERGNGRRNGFRRRGA
ncbi:MAG: DNA polymerase III subunit alpha [Desulfosarcinaceae bacterium]|nr:DNA polymerase III subunit alpha [Desulfosarcinaceae bacterium]